MGKETITDYKTVEETKTVYTCDHCNKRFETRDPLSTALLFDEYGSHQLQDPDRELHFCDDCCGIQSALEVEATHARRLEIVRTFGKRLGQAINLGAIIGVTVWLATVIPQTTFMALVIDASRGSDMTSFVDHADWTIAVMFMIVFNVLLFLIYGICWEKLESAVSHNE
jgi:hypothetical protein